MLMYGRPNAANNHLNKSWHRVKICSSIPPCILAKRMSITAQGEAGGPGPDGGVGSVGDKGPIGDPGLAGPPGEAGGVVSRNTLFLID